MLLPQKYRRCWLRLLRLPLQLSPLVSLPLSFPPSTRLFICPLKKSLLQARPCLLNMQNQIPPSHHQGSPGEHAPPPAIIHTRRKRQQSIGRGGGGEIGCKVGNAYDAEWDGWGKPIGEGVTSNDAGWKGKRTTYTLFTGREKARSVRPVDYFGAGWLAGHLQDSALNFPSRPDLLTNGGRGPSIYPFLSFLHLI